MSEFTFEIDTPVFEELDNFALLACQKYNYGNESDWFGSFRGGLFGSYARIYGINHHYELVHSWLPMPRVSSEADFHLASIFFNMDSFMECITYALNALGFCADHEGFRDVTNEKGLRAIKISDVFGSTRKSGPKQLSGYETIFSSVQSFWKSEAALLNVIIDLHDVSKHRECIFGSGMHRSGPPNGFYQSLGIGDDEGLKALFQPMKVMKLKSDPKIPRKERVQRAWKETENLEDLIPKFQKFVIKTGELALHDAKANIKLKFNEFQR